MAATKVPLTFLGIYFLLTAASANTLFDGEENPVYNVTIGSVEADDQEIGASVSTSFICRRLRIRVEGVIHTFLVRIGSITEASKVHLQIWRRVNDELYQIIRTKELENMHLGINEMNIKWYVTVGDYIGFSCDGFCPILKDPSDTNFISLIGMRDRVISYENDMRVSFTDHPLSSRIAIQVVMGANELPPPTTMEPGTGSTTTPEVIPPSKTPTNGKTDESTVVVVRSTDDPQGQVSNASEIGIWWVLIGAAIVIVILCIALCLVALCGWRHSEDKTIKKMDNLERLINSRPVSIISDGAIHYDDRGRPLSMVSSNFDTLQRTGLGLQRIHEIEVTNERRHPNTQSVTATVTPSPPRPANTVPVRDQPIVMFDNGLTNLDTSIPLPPPPPPLTAPPAL